MSPANLHWTSATDMLPDLVGRARAIEIAGYFRDIGTAEAYRLAQEEWRPRVVPMIVAQTPLRIGLVGGGTDLPGYYLEHGGRVLNCAIDKYVYVIVKQRFDGDIYVNYSKKEIVSRVEDLEHELVREAMQMTGVTGGVEITTLADIPSTGSGLGSSSSVTVGLLHALFAYQGRQVSGEDLAERACTIEIELCGKRIGKQDQYIAALGGIRDIRFGPGDQVVAEELQLSALERRALQEQVMLFYTGVTRSADAILREQDANIGCTLDQLHLLRDLAGHGSPPPEQRRSGRAGGRAARRLVHQAQTGRRRVERPDRRGGRPGHGRRGFGRQGHRCRRWGFLLVICPIERQGAVRRSLAEMPELPVRLDRFGSRVMLNMVHDIWN